MGEWVAAAKHVPTLKAPASAHELENFPPLTGIHGIRRMQSMS